jgi:hypothetical protein
MTASFGRLIKKQVICPGSVRRTVGSDFGTADGYNLLINKGLTQVD